MKKHFKPIVSLFLALCLMVGAATGALAASREGAADGAAAWLLKQVPVDPQDTQLDNAVDWTAIALSRGGYPGYEAYLAYLDGAVKANVAQMYLSDTARVALAAGAAGGDARKVGGHDLIAAIAGTDFSKELFTDGVSYALLALDSMQYALPEGVRQAVVDALCSAQRADGGFNYMLAIDPNDEYSKDGSVDTTGPVLAALAPYREDQAVAAVIDKALAFLKANQNAETAGFGFMGSDSAETISMAVIGLTALGIDPCGPDYVKNGKTMLDALLTFVNADGGMRGYDGNSNILTTYQALCALEAYARFAAKETAFYDYSDLKQEPTDTTTQPTDVTTQPTDVTTQPTDATTQPTDATGPADLTEPQAPEVSESAAAPEADNPATGSSVALSGIAALALVSACALVVSKKRTTNHD